MSVNVTRNPAIGGGGGGGGASAAEVAAAVVAALPAAPVPATAAQVAAAVTAALPAQLAPATPAQVAAAVVAAMPAHATVQSGQVVEFAAGQVPAGYEQISGPDTVSAGAWELAWPCYSHGQGVAGAVIVSAGGKLIAVQGVSASTTLQVLNDDYTPNGSAIALPSAYGITMRFLPLASGKLLRLCGAVSSGTSTSTNVQLFDPVARTVTSLQSKPTALGTITAAAETGTDVYVFNGTAVDRFRGNVWNESVATAPASVLSADTLPSGKVLLVCATAQYVFDPAALTFTAVGVPVAVSSSVVARSTATGVRVLDVNAIVAGLGFTMAAHDYNESAGLFTSLKPYARSPSSIASYFRVASGATKLPDGGLLINSSVSSGFDAVVHRVSYTPKGIVKAVKL